MMPADPDLMAVARMLRARDKDAHDKAAQTLRERDEAGLEVLLAVWQQEQKRARVRRWIGAAVLIAAVPTASALLRQPGTVIMLFGALVFIVGGILIPIILAQPTRLQMKMASVLATYEDPRILLPLAQLLRVMPDSWPADTATDSWEERQAIRRLLQHRPDRLATFPEARYAVGWVPERVHARIRWLPLWLSQSVLYGAVIATCYAFIGVPHDLRGVWVWTFLGPVWWVCCASQRLKDDIVYRRISPRPLWIYLIHAAALVLSAGLLDHLVTGRPSWQGLLWATVGIPAALRLRAVLEEAACVTPSPHMPAHLDS